NAYGHAYDLAYAEPTGANCRQEALPRRTARGAYMAAPMSRALYRRGPSVRSMPHIDITRDCVGGEYPDSAHANVEGVRAGGDVYGVRRGGGGRDARVDDARRERARGRAPVPHVHADARVAP